MICISIIVSVYISTAASFYRNLTALCFPPPPPPSAVQTEEELELVSEVNRLRVLGSWMWCQTLCNLTEHECDTV